MKSDVMFICEIGRHEDAAEERSSSARRPVQVHGGIRADGRSQGPRTVGHWRDRSRSGDDHPGSGPSRRQHRFAKRQRAGQLSARQQGN